MIDFKKIDWIKTALLVVGIAGPGMLYLQLRSLETQVTNLKASEALHAPAAFSRDKDGHLVTTVPVAGASSARALTKMISKGDRPILQRLQKHSKQLGSKASMIGEFNTVHRTDARLQRKTIPGGWISEFSDAYVNAQVFVRTGKQDSLHYEARDNKSVSIVKEHGETRAHFTGESPHDSTIDAAVFTPAERKSLLGRIPIKTIGIGTAAYLILNLIK
jgi:hypothetical protein